MSESGIFNTVLDFGAARASLRSKSSGLLLLATRLGPDASAGVDLGRLREIGKVRQSTHTGFSAERSLIEVGRPWLKFLGWWRKPIVVLQAQDQLDLYISWVRDEPALRLSVGKLMCSRTEIIPAAVRGSGRMRSPLT